MTKSPAGELFLHDQVAGTYSVTQLLAARSAPSTFPFSCTVSEAVGDLVKVTGDNEVRQADQVTHSPIIGVVVEKLSATSCLVQFQGLVTNVYTGLTTGANKYLGSAGRPTPTRPHGTEENPVFLVPVGVSLDSTSLWLAPGPSVKVRS